MKNSLSRWFMLGEAHLLAPPDQAQAPWKYSAPTSQFLAAFMRRSIPVAYETEQSLLDSDRASTMTNPYTLPSK
ncbi:MAG: hypothetical protein K8R23_02250 [Chthoniobacter sp.]|nr:hypothetical protein [Chthoniobacter sp.]